MGQVQEHINNEECGRATRPDLLHISKDKQLAFSYKEVRRVTYLTYPRSAPAYRLHIVEAE